MPFLGWRIRGSVSSSAEPDRIEGEVVEISRIIEIKHGVGERRDRRCERQHRKCWLDSKRSRDSEAKIPDG